MANMLANTRRLCVGVKMMFCLFLFFFFSSRRRHTRLTCDWSSDVCSSDLLEPHGVLPGAIERLTSGIRQASQLSSQFVRNSVEMLTGRLIPYRGLGTLIPRSEERRVGKECRSRGWPYHQKDNEGGRWVRLV